MSGAKNPAFHVQQPPLLICGSRTYSKFHIIHGALKAERAKWGYVVEGGAPGADTHARYAAMALRIGYRQYDAEWQKYGRAAGPLRNTRMLDSEPRLREVWAFVPGFDVWHSIGTLDMCFQALRRGLSVRLYGDVDLTWRALMLENGEVRVEGKMEAIRRV